MLLRAPVVIVAVSTVALPLEMTRRPTQITIARHPLSYPLPRPCDRWPLEKTNPLAKMLRGESRNSRLVKLRHRVEQLKQENEMTEYQIRLLREEIAYLKNILLKHQKHHETPIESD